MMMKIKYVVGAVVGSLLLGSVALAQQTICAPTEELENYITQDMGLPLLDRDGTHDNAPGWSLFGECPFGKVVVTMPHATNPDFSCVFIVAPKMAKQDSENFCGNV